MAKAKQGIASNVKMIMFLALGLFVILFSVVISNPQYQSFKKSDAAGFSKSKSPQTVMDFWSVNLGQIPLANINDGHCGTGANRDTTCKHIVPNGNYLTVTQGGSFYYSKYAAIINQNVFETNVDTAELYGRTHAPCTNDTVHFTLGTITDTNGDGIWDSYSNNLFDFGTLQTMGSDCQTNPFNDGWNYFRKQALFSGLPVTTNGAIFSIYPVNGGSLDFQIAEITINGSLNSFETCNCSNGQVVNNGCMFETAPVCSGPGGNSCTCVGII